MKEEIINHLMDKTQAELDKAKQVYETTKNLVQNGDLKSDGKYDTRATEANYLAEGQRQRVQDLEQEIALLKDLDFKTAHKKVAIGSLVKLRMNNLDKYFFVSPISGGDMIKIQDQIVMVVSAFSPIGDGALSLEEGESFEVEINSSTREYEVVSVC